MLFGSGFVFGVTFALFVLAVILASVVGGQRSDFVATQAFVVLVAGIVFPAIVGASPFLVALPANRQRVPLDTEREAVGPGGLADDVDAMDEVDGMELDAMEGRYAMEGVDEAERDLQG